MGVDVLRWSEVTTQHHLWGILQAFFVVGLGRKRLEEKKKKKVKEDLAKVDRSAEHPFFFFFFLFFFFSFTPKQEFDFSLRR